MQRFERQRQRDVEKAEPTDRLYIALEKFDLSFYPAEVKTVKDLWKRGVHLADIAEQIRREPEEVFSLLLDLASDANVSPRQNGVWGIAG